MFRAELSRAVLAGGKFLPGNTSNGTRSKFVAELSWVCETFSALVDGAPFSAVLEAVHTDKCRRFHIDYYRTRLLVTYAGPGTEYVLDEDVEPSAARRPAQGDRSVLRSAAFVRHASVGDVIVMKGRGYVPQAGYGGLVHRSPEIAERKVSRLLLALTEG